MMSISLILAIGYKELGPHRLMRPRKTPRYVLEDRRGRLRGIFECVVTGGELQVCVER
jgi:hypothetical protein